MSFTMILVMHLLVGLITQQMFKWLVISNLTPRQVAKLEDFIKRNTDYNMQGFVEITCNQTLSTFFFKGTRLFLALSGFLAPIGFYKLNKELGEM